MQPAGRGRPHRIAWLEPGRLPHGSGDLNIYSGILFPRAGPKMAALLRSLGYEVEVISGENAVIDVDEIARDFDTACISVLSNTAAHGLVLARWLHRRGLHVILGGYQFAHTELTPDSLAPTEEALDFAPYVVRGEGYVSLPQLLAALAGERPLSDVGGLSYRDARGVSVHNPPGPLATRDEINALPLQDWSTVRGRETMRVVAVHGMQGCPRECSWCAVWTRDGRQNRNTDAGRLVDELEASLPHGPFQHVFFSADNFPVLHTWATAVCEEIVRRGIDIGWTCQGEVGATQRGELLDLMCRAGCERWCLGLESINPASLQGSRKRQSRETMEQAVRELRRRGVCIHGMFIVGLPHDTPESVRETLAWAQRMGLETVQFLCLIDLPGSSDYERRNLAQVSFRPFEGALAPLNWMFVNGHYARLGNETMSCADVHDAVAEAMLRFYALPRAIGPLLGVNWAHYRTCRAHGRGKWASLRAARINSLFTGILRLRGWLNVRRWLRLPANQAYRALLSAAPEQAEALRERLLAQVPLAWVATLHEVHRERLARRERLGQEACSA